jgi:glycosyltransferase involved in cell wall biosynthesis
MSLVSIIIPAHNSERTILECISSAVNQTYSKLEIIVVNDRSTDNTHSLLLQLDDPRIKFLTTSVGSASAARNFGLDFASGEYIQFLDADDVLELNKIQHQLQKLEMSSPKSIANCPWGHFSTSTSDSAVQRQKIDCDSIPIRMLANPKAIN